MSEPKTLFNPDLVFFTASGSSISLPEPRSRDDAARMHLAFLSLGRAFRSLNAIVEHRFEAEGTKWVLAGPNITRPNAQSIARYQDLLSGFRDFPNYAVGLVINKLTNEITGKTRFPFGVVQANVLILRDTREARNFASEIFLEAQRQAVALRVHNEFASSKFKLRPVVKETHENTGKYSEEPGKNLRIQIEYEDGGSQRFWVDRLPGFNDSVKDAEFWVAKDWKPASDVVRWRFVNDRHSSTRDPRGWVVIADAVGDAYHNDDPEILSFIAAGRPLAQFGPFVVFKDEQEQLEIVASNKALHAVRQNSDGQWSVINVDKNDIVLSKVGDIIFSSEQTGNFSQVIDFRDAATARKEEQARQRAQAEARNKYLQSRGMQPS